MTSYFLLSAITDRFNACNQLIGLVHAPADLHRLLAPMERGLQLGAVLDDPPVDRGVIDMHTTFEHEFLNMACAQRIRHVSAYAHENDILRKMGPLEAHRH